MSNLTVITGKKSGPSRQPLEKRKSLSPNPHKNRAGPKDLPAGETLNLKELPVEPPIELGKYERECWDQIAESQRGMNNSAWIYRSDCSFLIATCALYARWREIRDELNAHKEANGTFIYDESGKAHPLLAQEAGILSKYHSSLGALGLVPTRRMVTLAEDKEDDDDGLLAM